MALDLIHCHCPIPAGEAAGSILVCRRALAGDPQTNEKGIVNEDPRVIEADGSHKRLKRDA